MAASAGLSPPRAEALRPEPDQPPYDRVRWFLRLVSGFRPTTEVALKDYDKCFVLSPGIFTDASLEATLRKFKVFPDPAPLRQFLIDWGEEHRSRGHPDKYRRKGSLNLTNEERRRLVEAAEAAHRDRTPIPDGPVKQLTNLHVHIAHILASWQGGQASHEQLALAAGTSVRTVRRALPALRAIGLLPGIRELSSPKPPKNVWGIKQVMDVIAAHTGRSVKTLYRWEREARLGKPH